MSQQSKKTGGNVNIIFVNMTNIYNIYLILYVRERIQRSRVNSNPCSKTGEYSAPRIRNFVVRNNGTSTWFSNADERGMSYVVDIVSHHDVFVCWRSFHPNKLYTSTYKHKHSQLLCNFKPPTSHAASLYPVVNQKMNPTCYIFVCVCRCTIGWRRHCVVKLDDLFRPHRRGTRDAIMIMIDDNDDDTASNVGKATQILTGDKLCHARISHTKRALHFKSNGIDERLRLLFSLFLLVGLFVRSIKVIRRIRKVIKLCLF